MFKIFKCISSPTKLILKNNETCKFYNYFIWLVFRLLYSLSNRLFHHRRKQNSQTPMKTACTWCFILIVSISRNVTFCVITRYNVPLVIFSLPPATLHEGTEIVEFGRSFGKFSLLSLRLKFSIELKSLAHWTVDDRKCCFHIFIFFFFQIISHT